MREGSLEAPTRHPLDWQNPWFWDEAALEKEMERVFDICHGCRRCFNLCDSFPRLFDLIDNGPTGEVDGVPKERLRRGRAGLHALRHVLHDQVPLRAAASVERRFPAPDAAPSRGAGAQEAASASSRASSPTPTAPAGSAPSPPGLINWATDERNQPMRRTLREGRRHPSRRAPAQAGRRDLRGRWRIASPSRSTRRRPPTASARRCSTPPAS